MSKERAARKLLTSLRDLIRFAEEVEALGRVEAAMKDAERRRQEAETALADATVEMEKARAAAKQARSAETKATAGRDKIIGEAEKEAERIVAEASERAKSIVREAGQRGAEKERKAQAEIDDMQRKFAEQRKAHDAWVAEAEGERKDLEQRIAALNKHIARIREKVVREKVA